MTPTFKRNMKAALERLDADPTADGWHGRAQTELGERVGLTKSAIGKILTVQTTSTKVPDIARELNIPLPVIGHGTDDAEIAEVVRMFGRLDVEGRLAFMSMLRRAVK